MAQIAITPPTALKAPPSAPPSSSDTSPFSPHLENAIAEQKPVQDRQSTSAPVTNTDVNDDNGRQLGTSISHEKKKSEAALEKSSLQGAASDNAANQAVSQIPELFEQLPLQDKSDGVKDTEIPSVFDSLEVATALLPNESNSKNVPDSIISQAAVNIQSVTNASESTASKTVAESMTAPPENSGHSQSPSATAGVVRTMQAAGDTLTEIFSGNTGADPEKNALKSSDNQAFSPIKMSPGSDAIKSDGAAGTIKGNVALPETEPLLARLQEIINNSNETGRVSINRTASSHPAAASTAPAAIVTEAGQPAVVGFSQVSEDGLQTTQQRTEQQPSLRHNVQQQYYNAKVGSDGLGDENASAQNSSQDNSQTSNTGSSGSTLTQSSSGVSTADQPGTFAQVAANAQQSAAQLSTETARPVILPSGTIIQEENVVQQFMDRFHIARRIAESKINIKLHPAELGELKIDLSVKEGSIKASVVAQNQQVQEIIERNIARLRSVLEEQGFNLDAVTVTTESDSVGDYDLFDRQLFSQHNHTSPENHQKKEVPTTFDQEIVTIANSTDASGVNVRI